MRTGPSVKLTKPVWPAQAEAVLLRKQRPDDLRHRPAQLRMLVGIEVDAVHAAGRRDAVRIEDVAA